MSDPAQTSSTAGDTRLPNTHFRGHSNPVNDLGRGREWHGSTISSSSSGVWTAAPPRRWSVSVQTALAPMLPASSSPPPLRYTNSPYQPVPLPSQIDDGSHTTTLTLNPVLEYVPNRLESLLRFDLSQPPSSIITPPDDPFCLMQPATTPMIPSLAITSPLLPWPIVVHRSSLLGTPAGVTVADVVGTLCSSMRIRLDDSDEEETGEDEAPENGAPQRPPKTRLSLLGGRHKFMGLSRSEIGGDTWELHVDR